MSMSRFKHVCLFGTSANPPTGSGGHVGVVSYLASLDNFDEIRVLPVYAHMFREKRNKLLPFQNRMEMCRLAFQHIPKVVVSSDEKVCFEQKSVTLKTEEEKCNLRVGTADLLEMLLTNEPNTKFSLALGTDTFLDLTSFKWKRSKDVISLLEGRIVVIYRSIGTTIQNCEIQSQTKLFSILDERVQSVNSEFSNDVDKEPVKILNIKGLSDVSSTRVRSTKDQGLLSEWINRPVLEYIVSKKLYSFSDE